MEQPLLIGLVAAGLILILQVVLLVVLLVRRPQLDLSALRLHFTNLEKAQERIERTTREEIAQGREESSQQGRALREEVTASIGQLSDLTVKRLGEVAEGQRRELEAFKERLEVFAANLAQLTERMEKKHEELRLQVDQKLGDIQQDNTKKLEEMRKTVEEKLEGTLEKRLGESFKQVSERLEQVYLGLGEMQSLAHGVGDLKKVLTNVKTRGTWGEVQLGNLLQQVLAPDQYAQNVATRPNSSERVEYAIRLPGQGDGADEVVWLPIDAKFPQEDYQRLVEASENADAAAIEQASKQLGNAVRESARTIQEKYICPPSSTDFAIMFLPTEGLYAEVLRRPGLSEQIQREHRVVIAGPTTLAALLNSLQMGFRTLAIQQRSSEVWAVLGAVKTEFGKFGAVLDKVGKKLSEANKVVDQASVRTRAIERKLRSVEELPQAESSALLGEIYPEREAEAEGDGD